MSNPEIKVFLASERRSRAPWIVALLGLFLIAAAALYLFSGTSAPQKTVNTTPPATAHSQPLERPAPVQTPVAPVPAVPLLDATFDTGNDGFQYVDDAFRSTQQPEYAQGNRMDAGVPQRGVLQVLLGGKDSKDIRGMSGGWRRTFTVEKAGPLMLSFRYVLMQTSDYEADEFSQALVTVDAQHFGAVGKDYLAQFTGDGNGGANPNTGWQTFSVSLGQLAPGPHVLTIGAYNNKKTAPNETTEVRIDEVRIAADVPGGTKTRLLPAPIAPAPPIKKLPEPSVNRTDDTF